jgi:hypothetical protein
MSARYPSIPEPQPDVENLLATVQALKETIEVLTGQRGLAPRRVATMQDLIDMALIIEDEIP